MKRLLTTGLVLLAMAGASASFAQSKRTYDDDIYYNSKNTKETQEETPPARTAAPQQSATAADEADQSAGAGNEDTYSSSGNNYDSRNSARSNDDDYVNYEDDYYYSTRISRFNNPFYNRGYYSTFNNPYWYDPYWVDPYWGWSPWTRPGISISFGGGPYWSSYWGWQSWYGYGGFNSYYGYPGYGMYGGYYSGYWNGYYAGLYNNYGYGSNYGYGGRYRTITYGPRYSLNANNNAHAHNIGYQGFRREARNSNNMQSAPLSESNTPRASSFRSVEGTNGRSPRDNSAVAPHESAAAVRTPVQANDNRFESNDRGAREPFRGNDAAPARARDAIRFDNSRTPEASPRGSRWNDNGAVRSEQQNTAPAEQPRRERGFFGRSEQQRPQAAPARSFEQPRAEQQQQRSFSQPRMEQRSEPARNFGGGNSGGGRSFGGGNSGGGRSFGGGNSGGGGGGGFRGGRR